MNLKGIAVLPVAPDQREDLPQQTVFQQVIPDQFIFAIRLYTRIQYCRRTGHRHTLQAGSHGRCFYFIDIDKFAAAQIVIAADQVKITRLDPAAYPWMRHQVTQ